jgi:prepilin-type N-terminal cleavage/methylation domain-containing protein
MRLQLPFQACRPARPPSESGGAGGVGRGFTLVEMVGVLVIIVILAAAVLPSLIKSLDRAALAYEGEALRDMAGALQRIAVTRHRIPGTNTAFAELATELGWLLSETATNNRANGRVFMVDPALRIGPGTGATLPYTQDFRGSTNPVSARVLLLGSIGSPLPAIMYNPGSSASTVFNLLWNAADGVTPTGWTTSWGGDFDDMVIQRLNLDPLFVQLFLNKSPTSALPLYAVDEGVRARVTNAPFAAYFLLGTRLDLFDTVTNLQTRQILQDAYGVTNRTPFVLPPSFVFESGIWRGRLFLTSAAQRRTGTDLQAAYAVFMAAAANPNAKPTGTPVTQAQVTTDMFKFMSNYMYWSTNSFSSGTKTGVTNALTALVSDSKNYLGK